MHLNLAGKKQSKQSRVKPSLSDDKSLGRVIILFSCLDLENEDKKQHMEKSTLSNGELL